MKSFFIIVLYLVFSFTSDKLSGWLFVVDNRAAAYAVQNAFTIIEYTLFSLLLYLEIQSKAVRTIILVFTGIFYFISIYNDLNSSPHFDSLNVTIESILVISYSIYFFFEQINIPRVTFIYSLPQFWIVSGILIYLASTFFLFMQADVLSQREKEGFWIIAILGQIIKNILFVIAFLTKNHSTKSFKEFDNQRIYTEF